MFCTKCGTKNEDTNVYCKNCGAKLVKPVSNNTSSQSTINVSGVVQMRKPVRATLIAGIAAAVVVVMVVGVLITVGKGNSNKPLFEQIEFGKTTAAELEKYFDKNNLGCVRNAEDSIYTNEGVLGNMGHDFLLQLDDFMEMEWDERYGDKLLAFFNGNTYRNDLTDILWGSSCEYFISVSGDANNKSKDRKVLYASCCIPIKDEMEKRTFKQQLNNYLKKHKKTDLKNRKFDDKFELNLTFYPLEITSWEKEKVLTCLCFNEIVIEDGTTEIALTLYAEPYFTDKELNQILKEKVCGIYEGDTRQRSVRDMVDYIYDMDNTKIVGLYNILTLYEMYPEFQEEQLKEIAKEFPDYICSIDSFYDEEERKKGIIVKGLTENIKGDIIIPETICSYPVLKIESNVFEYCTDITSLQIPDSVTYIGECAFSACSGLTRINIPDGITEIKGETFSDCSSLTNITIPDGATSIESRAFANCSSLTSINIPSSVTDIANDAFDGCDNLVSDDLSARFPNAVPKPAWLEPYRAYVNENWANEMFCFIGKDKEGVPSLVSLGGILVHYNGTEVEYLYSSQDMEYNPSTNKIYAISHNAMGPGIGWHFNLIDLYTGTIELSCSYFEDYEQNITTYYDNDEECSEEEFERVSNEMSKRFGEYTSVMETMDISDIPDYIYSHMYDSIDEAYQAYIANKGSISATGSSASSTGSASAQAESVSEYILKDSDSRYLTKADLQGFSAEDCRLARNEIYARHGRKFDDEGLQSYFNSCSWYQGTIEPSDFQETMLSDVEIANKDLIVEYEKEMGYR